MSRLILTGARNRGGSAPTSVSVSGTVTIGGTLTCTATGATSYQWQRAATFGGGGSFSNIGGATSSTYTPVAADMGFDIQCVATNGFGSTTSSNTLRSFTDFASYSPTLLLDERSITSSGGAISAWGDQSGSARDFAQSSATLKPATGVTLNGHACVDFDGSNDAMTATATLANIATASAFHIFAVFRPDTASRPYTAAGYYNANCLLADDQAYMAFGVGDVSGTKKAFLGAYDTSGHSASDTITTGSFLALEGRFSSGTLGLRVGSNSEVTASSGNLGATSNTLRLGHMTAGGSSWFDGPVALIIVFNAQQSSGVRADIRALIANKYGVAT